MKIGCAVLAGGKSLRMGEDKALLEYHGETFIERICEQLSFFDEKMIARGNRDVTSIYVEDDWTMIADEYPEHGPIGGLHAVLKNCSSDALFCVSCDIPLLSRELAKMLCAALTDDVEAVVAVTADEKVHPLCAVYRKELYKRMEKRILEDNNRLMAMLKEFTIQYVYLDEGTSSQLLNVNTRNEYESIKRT